MSLRQAVSYFEGCGFIVRLDTPSTGEVTTIIRDSVHENTSVYPQDSFPAIAEYASRQRAAVQSKSMFGPRQ